MLIQDANQAQPKPEPSNQQPRQSTGTAHPNLWLEYHSNTHFSYLIDLSNYYQGAPRIMIGPSVTEAGSMQICAVSRTCTTSETPDMHGNYFDGTKLHNTFVTRGGELASGDTDFWMVKHPTTDTADGVWIVFYQRTDGFVLSSGGGDANYKEIGFQTKAPTVTPRTTANQYQVSWPNPIRYTPNQQGLIERASQLKGIEDKITYWVQTSTNRSFASQQETEFGPTELTVSNDRYQATITHNHPPNTQIWARVRYQETRFEVVYDIYSQPTSLTTPTTPGGGNTPTVPSAQPTPTSSPATRPLPTPSTQPTPTGGGNNPVGLSGNAGNLPSPASVEGPDQTTNPGFTDTAGSVHETNIIQLAVMGVTRGCNPPENTRFCPDRAVTRGEMATFLVRAFELAPTNEDPFTDTQGNVHRPNINRMAAAGISRGCNPPTNTRFCPERAVTI